MPATATKAKAATRPAASKKSSAPTERSGPQLNVRYSSVMKPQKVHALTVEVPKPRKRKGEDEVESLGVVVVRPVIPGAVITPTEQRLEVEPGNQVTFYVTPLARGRLPRARLEVFAPNQPPQPIALWMKAKTQRFALVLFLLAFLMPMLLKSYTTGSLAPSGGAASKDSFVEPLTKGFPPVPVLNRPIDTAEDSFLGKYIHKQWTLADTVGEGYFLGYRELRQAFLDKPWLSGAIGAGFMFLAFLAFLVNKPRKKVLKRNLKSRLGAGADESREVATLEPI